RMVEGLNAIPGIRCRAPEGAFYVFPSVEGLYGKRSPAGVALTGSLALSGALLEEARIAAVPGAAFGADGHLRLSFVTSMEKVEKGLERLGAFVASLR